MKYAFILILFLTSCSVTKLTPEQLTLLKDIRPTCNSPLICEKMWYQAKEWVIENANYRIDIYSDTLIETYPALNGTGGSSGQISARVDKEPLDAGRYAFNLSTGCNTVVFCPDLFELQKSFADKLNSVK